MTRGPRLLLVLILYAGAGCACVWAVTAFLFKLGGN